MSILKNTVAAARTLLVLGTLTACSNPVERDVHLTPRGVVVTSEDGVELVRVGPNEVVTGQVTVAPGASRSLRIWFVNAAGDPIALDGVEYSLRAEVVNPQIASFTKEGEDRGRLQGLAPGSTQLRLHVWHGTHADFSRTVPLVVQ
jgi:hypothetical protein